VFEIAFRALEVRFVFGDLIFKRRSRRVQVVSLLLNFTYRKGVLFKLLFDRCTPLVCRFQRLLQPAKVRICLL
jgi:hypothetical protein